ncbi:HIT family protein [Nocardia veterana]|uniref:HIT family protein n=1 Tax=Nocardia veterana TaxID=132249 RepID=A0A7X6LU98_9NOCA|nr:HIT family protein [Nocardia veterana]NKY84196.1 HIT family protein [Nocardia veterana]
MDPYRIFADIVAGRAPASKVYEDADVLAFMDIRPMTPGHLLVIPKVPARSLAELDPAVGGKLFQVGQRLAAALRASEVNCDGVNFFLADGVTAGQEVFHVHLHVIPRTPGDGFGLRFRATTPPRADLDYLAASIRGALQRAEPEESGPDAVGPGTFGAGG